MQSVDNKVVSIITTLDSANEKVSGIRKSKTGNVWQNINQPYHQPNAIHRDNKHTNGVDRSAPRLWWKSLFFHLFDIAVVKGFMLFREHQANYPDGEAQQRPKEYSFADFRDEFEILGKSVVFPII